MSKIRKDLQNQKRMILSEITRIQATAKWQSRERQQSGSCLEQRLLHEVITGSLDRFQRRTGDFKVKYSKNY